MMVSVDEHGPGRSPLAAEVAVVSDKVCDASLGAEDARGSSVSPDCWRSPHDGTTSSGTDPAAAAKRYFCQRCLNHGLEFPRKGHKPECKYYACKCDLCMMVEQRRQINYQLSIRKPDEGAEDGLVDGRKIRNPKCARCSAHGKKQALRGHKKATCPFNNCRCEMCALVENRRVLMARQIRVRRTQQKQRQQLSTEPASTSGDDGPCASASTSEESKPEATTSEVLVKPTPQPAVCSNAIEAPLLVPVPSKPSAVVVPSLGHTEHSAFRALAPASVPAVPPQPLPSLASATAVVSCPDWLLKLFLGQTAVATAPLPPALLPFAGLSPLLAPPAVSAPPVPPSLLHPLYLQGLMGAAFLPVLQPTGDRPA